MAEFPERAYQRLDEAREALQEEDPKEAQRRIRKLAELADNNARLKAQRDDLCRASQIARDGRFKKAGRLLDRFEYTLPDADG